MRYNGLRHCLIIMQAEVKATKGIKLKGFIFLYRLASYSTSAKRLTRIIFSPFNVLYRFYSEVLIGMDWPACVIAGPGLRVHHGYAIVIHPKTVIGEDFSIRQGVTIGSKQNISGSFSSAPCIGNNVDLGANSVVVGNIIIGNNVTVGAGTVIAKNIEDGMTAVGASFRILARR